MNNLESRRAALRAIALSGAMLAATTANAAVEVSTKPTANMNCAGGVCTPTAKKAVLNVTDLATMLASGDVTIKSDAPSQDIEINAALSWTGTQRLTLDAYHSIAFHKPIVVAGTGAMTITTNDGGSDGDFGFAQQGDIEFWDSQSHLSINGHSYRLIAKISDLVHALKHNNGSGQYFAIQKHFNSQTVYSAPVISTIFNGVLEGLGNKISHLTIHNDSGFAGFLLSIDSNGIIRDLHLIDANVSGSGLVGALATSNLGTIVNCFASGEVSSTKADSVVGGLVGNNAGKVSRSGSSAAVFASGNDSIVGGLFGQNLFAAQGIFGAVDQSYATGTVNGGDGGTIGGLVGKNYAGAVSNSYATGSVTGGTNALAGGLIGTNQYNPDLRWAPQISTSYSTGAVSSGSSALTGGLIGQDDSDAENVSVYWDLDTSSIGDPSKGAGNIANDPGITGLSDAQLKSGLPTGFDKKVWKQSAAINNGYPYLIDNPPR